MTIQIIKPIQMNSEGEQKSLTLHSYDKLIKIFISYNIMEY